MNIITRKKLLARVEALTTIKKIADETLAEISTPETSEETLETPEEALETSEETLETPEALETSEETLEDPEETLEDPEEANPAAINYGEQFADSILINMFGKILSETVEKTETQFTEE